MVEADEEPEQLRPAVNHGLLDLSCPPAFQKVAKQEAAPLPQPTPPQTAEEQKGLF